MSEINQLTQPPRDSCESACAMYHTLPLVHLFSVAICCFLIPTVTHTHKDNHDHNCHDSLSETSATGNLEKRPKEEHLSEMASEPSVKYEDLRMAVSAVGSIFFKRVI